MGLTRTAAAKQSGVLAVAPAAGVLAVVLGWLVSQGQIAIPLAGIAATIGFLQLAREPRRGLAWAVLIVLLVPPSTAFAGGKINVIRVAGLLVLLAIALDRHATLRTVRFTLVDLSIAGFLFVGLAGWLLTPQPPHGSSAAIDYLLPIVLYIGARRFAGDVVSLLRVVFVGGSLASLTVLYEALIAHRPLFADPTSYYWLATASHIFRPGGVFGGPPEAASVLAMSILCGLPLVAGARGMQRAALILCMAVSTVALLLTFTRGPLIGLLLGVFLYSVLLGPATWARYTYVGASLALVAAILLLPRIGTATIFQKGVLRTGTLNSRAIVWRQASALITNSTSHLLFGHGTNSLVIGLPWLPGRAPADIARVPDLTLGGAQNQYIRTLLEGGLTGLLCFLGWVVGTTSRGIAASFRRSRVRRELAAMTAACAVFLVTSLVDDTLRQPQTAAVIALITGLLISLSDATTHAEDQ